MLTASSTSSTIADSTNRILEPPLLPMIKPQIGMLHALQNRALFRDTAASLLLDGKLVIVVGAGVSMPFGLADWKQLVTRLFQREKAPRPTGLSLERQAEYFRTGVCAGDNEKFLKSVSDALYEGVVLDGWKLRENRTLAALGTLISSSRRGQVAKVLTFNFDDLLEWYLEFHGYVVHSIVEERHWAKNADVTIYHPHGLLPLRSGVSRSTDIVLDQAAFTRVVGRDHAAWRQELVTLLRTHFALFIGLSGSDQHLDVLLTEAAENHVLRVEHSDFWGLRLTTVTPQSATEKATRQWWHSRGIGTLRVKDYHTDLAALLFEICQRAAQLGRR
jgi:hypothetical protein